MVCLFIYLYIFHLKHGQGLQISRQKTITLVLLCQQKGKSIQKINLVINMEYFISFLFKSPQKEKELMKTVKRNNSTESECNDTEPCGSRLSTGARAAMGWCCDVGSSVCALVSNLRLAAVTMVVFYLWFTAAFTYYGISLYSVNLR